MPDSWRSMRRSRFDRKDRHTSMRGVIAAMLLYGVVIVALVAIDYFNERGLSA